MRKHHKRDGRCLIALLLLVLFTAISCDENPAGNDNDEMRLRLRIYAGNNQTDRAGATLPDPLVVQVRNIIESPQPGIEVLFEATDPGGSVSTPSAITDQSGLASCTFTLGPNAGEQRVKVTVVDEDSTMFTATAVAIECEEERPTRVCHWASDRVYITTTSSTLLDGTGTVLIEYDPVSGEAVELVETGDILTDISFSPRGELFVTSVQKIIKVDPTIYKLNDFLSYDVQIEAELEANSGGILAGVSLAGPFGVACPPDGVFYLDLPGQLQHVQNECLAAHPVTRDLFIITGSGPPTYKLWRIPWDGRQDEAEIVLHADITTGAATPRGMCIDSTGTVYITFDGNDNFRRIVTVSADGSVDAEFIDFYAEAGGNSQLAGRWGDIAYADGKLYLIDTRNNRLATITVETQSIEMTDEDFRLSKSGIENERYGIAVRPPWMCADITMH
jgi:hypothetical protein